MTVATDRQRALTLADLSDAKADILDRLDDLRDQTTALTAAQASTNTGFALLEHAVGNHGTHLMDLQRKLDAAKIDGSAVVATLADVPHGVVTWRVLRVIIGLAAAAFAWVVKIWLDVRGHVT